jgi:ABC-type polysaccharide/polyol phosphate export permease
VLLLAAGYGFGFRISGGPLSALAIVGAAVAFGLGFAVLSAWLGLLIKDPETAERVLFFPAIAVAFVSSAFAPIGLLANWMQPIARVNPVSAACGVIRALASGGSLGFPLLELCCWVLGLFLVPGFLAVRRWQAIG